MKQYLQSISNVLKDRKYINERMYKRKFQSPVTEGGGVNSIFEELKGILQRAVLGSNSTINVSVYKEADIINALKKIGYEFKQPINNKLHFFNQMTSVSVYLSQSNRHIYMVP
jgi:hypothetical protein